LPMCNQALGRLVPVG